MSEPGAGDDIAAARRALLDRRTGRHQRRYLRHRTLIRRARELTTALLLAETHTPEPPAPVTRTMEGDDDDGLKWFQR
ncbi:hypothetical protein [Methylobrevis pamukkalensis]|uniref:Uncharacterized protein n=1 Tax=Methylobrevis pamukkalensis TaxID=1439726 RepID=A0A1E3H4G5_9HYPH|nr:hypothetical protein [Methylobrevis pamukkalensis]ODN71204.1 hypothetical protein A6302_01493 [Methylobrevis pamukkalensis]